MDPIWHYVQRTQFTQDEHYTDHVNLRIQDSTIFNGKLFYAIQRTGVYIHEWFFSQSNQGVTEIPINENAGYIRVENDTMYGLDNGIEYMMYHYDLNVGDTAFIGSTSGIVPLGVVESIDTIYLGSVSLRRFFIENSPDFIIEGVGTHHGLFRPTMGIEWQGDLQCYHLGLNDVYIDSIGFPSFSWPVECLTNVSNEEFFAKDILMFPNPTSGFIRFDQLKNSKGFIYDLAGKLLMAINENESSVDVSFLDAGVYCFRVVKDGQISSALFVKEP